MGDGVAVGIGVGEEVGKGVMFAGVPVGSSVGEGNKGSLGISEGVFLAMTVGSVVTVTVGSELRFGRRFRYWSFPGNGENTIRPRSTKRAVTIPPRRHGRIRSKSGGNRQTAAAIPQSPCDGYPQ
ncbi:MAG: hypothetical protein IJL03_07310 [Lachnospiraceae bacterium]|nr:hypothetical protein [Lachnospiraceae bacterium]